MANKNTNKKIKNKKVKEDENKKENDKKNNQENEEERKNEKEVISTSKITKEDKIIAAVILILAILLGYFIIYQIKISIKRGIESDECPFNVNKCLPSTTIVLVPSTLKENEIILTFPQENEEISSPLKIEGKARGNWFFEGQFPVELYDKNDHLLGKGLAHSLSDWTTNNYVPFEALIDFVSSSKNSGYLKLLNDNPSGLVENQKVFIIPVRFK